MESRARYARSGDIAIAYRVFGDGLFDVVYYPGVIAESMPDLGLQIRAGLHTGECELVDGRIAGIAVHIGARVAAQARPSEVLVSSTVVAGSQLIFEDRGSPELEGVPGEWHLFAADPASARVS